MMLADCTFIDRGENLLITGALGRQACSLGHRTLYFGMHRFLERITMTKLDGSYVKFLNQLEKAPLVILDDFGLHPLDGVNQLALLQLLEDRYGKRSTIITSQLPVSKWYEYIGDSTIADAIMDRLSVSAHRFELKGASLSLNNSRAKNRIDF